jgi:hypothetical protein
LDYQERGLLMKAIAVLLPLAGSVLVLELVRVKAWVLAFVMGSVVAMMTALAWVLALGQK